MIATAGVVSGAITSYALFPGNSLVLVGIAIISAAGLTLVWAIFSTIYSRKSDNSADSALKKATLPFAATAALPILFFPIVLLKIPFEETMAGQPLYFPQPLTLTWQTTIMLISSAGLVLSLIMYRFPDLLPRFIGRIAERPALVLACMLLVWIPLVSALDIMKTNYLHGGANIAMFTESLRNVASDEGPLHSYLFQGDGSSLLGVHASFIWYFVYPFFRIWPTSEWLLILSDIALGLAAIPVYLLSRQFFGKGMCLMLAVIFLMSRVVISQPALGELSEERFLPVLLISTFYFLQVKRFVPFVVFSLLSLTIREDVGIILFLLGVLSLIRRRRTAWWLLPMFLGLAWFIVMIKGVIPSMNPVHEATRPLIIYRMYGESLPEIISTILFNSQLVFGTVFSDVPHLITIYYIWQSYGFGVLLFSWEFIVAIPALAETLLIHDSYPDHINMSAIAAAAFPAFIIGLATLEGLARRKWKVSVATSLALITLFSAVALSYSWFSPDWYQPRYNQETAMLIIEKLPPDASVVLPMYLTVKALPTQKVSSYYQVPYEIAQKGDLSVEQDYIVLDLRTFPAYGRNLDGYLKLRDKVLSSPDFIKVFERDDLQLYVRSNKIAQ